ncbi:anti-sigma factor [Gaiella sp.]|uniref:anti-sigma factor n=1 Tax=Gaiella sp. TaxID=2663207 RepID=UPI0039835B0F
MADRGPFEDPHDDQDFARVDGLLREMAPPATLPVGLRERTLAAIAAEAATSTRPRRRRARWLSLPRLRWRLPRFALAGAGALAAVGLALVFLSGGDDRPGLELRAELIAPADSRVTARADVTKIGVGRVIRFDTTKLPILPKGQFYELWFVGPGDSPRRPNRISAGTFHPDEQGRSRVTFAAAVDPAKYPVLSVTAEPGDGDPRPTGPEVLRSTDA